MLGYMTVIQYFKCVIANIRDYEFCLFVSRRYGCTCRTYMYMDRMCPHIHVVAGKQGNPGPEWVEESLAEDTIGLPECLRRLHRLNYRERMVTLQPLIDEFVDLLKVRVVKKSLTL